MSLVVLAPGPLSTLQDLGRPGLAGLGVCQGGAADRAATRRANRLVGNDAAAVVVESLLGGLRLRTDRRHVVATAGAPARVTVDGHAVATSEPIAVPAGSTLAIEPPVSGLRTYLAVQGGIGAPLLLGSASGGPGLPGDPLAAGDVLTVAARHGTSHPDVVPGAETTWGGLAVVHLVLGPHDDLFTSGARALVTGTTWRATTALDRVGVRLDGPHLTRARPDVLPGHGLLRGAVQVTPDGRPVVLLADHPTTGTHPVVGVVVERDVDRLAQVRPGDAVRFVRVPPPFVPD